MKKVVSYCALVLAGAAAFHFAGQFIRPSYPLEPKWYALPLDIVLWIAEARGDHYAWDTRAGYAVWALECLLFGLLFRAAVTWTAHFIMRARGRSRPAENNARDVT